MSRTESWLAAWRRLPHPLRWIGVASVGGALILVGIVFLVLPGPGIPLILLGLAILATEFVWAQVVLERIKHHGTRALRTILRKDRSRPNASGQGTSDQG
jgi:uncharacterized protein (TIGR02611 family)